MAGKLTFLVGFGAGYVLGARAGRQRYEQIASKARGLWQDPRVQKKADQAQHLAKEKGSAAASAVAEKAADVGSTVATKTKDAVHDKVGGSSGDHASTPSASGDANGTPAGVPPHNAGEAPR